MLSIFALYLIGMGALITFIWLRLAAKKRSAGGLTRRDSRKLLAGALLSWLLLAVISGLIYVSLLNRLLAC